MNADLDEIMLLSAQYAARLVQEYVQQRNIKEVSGKAQYLVEQISEYLCEDRSTLVIKKSAVEYHVAFMIGFMKKMTTATDDSHNKLVPLLNELHKDFKLHCQDAEEIFENAQNNILKSVVGKNKM